MYIHYQQIFIECFFTAEIDVDEQWQQHLWELSDDERVDFICALQSKLIRDFRKAVADYKSVS